MLGSVEFWFDFSSPYAHFAAQTLEARLARFDREIHWRPFLLGAVFKLTGMGPLSRTPLRGDYARRDWERLSRMLGVPFVFPTDHPYASQATARAFYWMEDHGLETAAGFAKAAFRAYFAEGRDLRPVASVIELAAGFGADEAVLADWLGSEEAKARLRAATDIAVAKGVFGSPFFLADGEPFWGWDRIAMLEQWLEQGCWR